MTTQTQTRQWWDEGRDDYGRPTRLLYRVGSPYALGAVVTLPRRTAATRPTGHNYLVNDWTLPHGAPGKVTYWATLTTAKAHLAVTTEGKTR